MTQALTKNLMCVCIRGNVEIWIEEDRARTLRDMLVSSTTHQFVKVGEEIFNTENIIGIFTAAVMEERTRRKNGQWQCEYSKWHENGAEGRQDHYWCTVDAKKSRKPEYAKPYKDDVGF